ncbi:ecotin family protein [Sphingobacterium sp. HJSM2_6]|uniref:ecotin family protein n=1 Tax=Sphingobacterium sp. HJSM2_6 TaxID=3366264 RepID=UPI003BCD546F
MNMKFFTLTLSLLLGLFMASNAQEMVLKVDPALFPQPDKGYKKMIIEVPYSSNDALKKIEFLVGKTMEVDGCNHFALQGTLEKKDLQGWGYEYYVFQTKGEVIATQMGCPDAPKRQLFVAAQPTLVRYNGKMPIVIYVPEEYDVQFKIYQTDKEVYRAAEAKKSKN